MTQVTGGYPMMIEAMCPFGNRAASSLPDELLAIVDASLIWISGTTALRGAADATLAAATLDPDPGFPNIHAFKEGPGAMRCLPPRSR